MAEFPFALHWIKHCVAAPVESICYSLSVKCLIGITHWPSFPRPPLYSVAWSAVKCRLYIGWNDRFLWIMNWKRFEIWNIWVAFVYKYMLLCCKDAITLSFKEDLKITTIDSQGVRSPGWDTNLVSVEYDAGLISIPPWRWVFLWTCNKKEPVSLLWQKYCHIHSII